MPRTDHDDYNTVFVLHSRLPNEGVVIERIFRDEKKAPEPIVDDRQNECMKVSKICQGQKPSDPPVMTRLRKARIASAERK